MGKAPKGISIKQRKEEYRNANDQYYEAILQLRGNTEEQFNEIVDRIEASECKISKHTIMKEGIDLYLFSQKYIQQLGRWIKNRYNCNIASTRKLHTRDVRANKNLYRVTVCVRFLKYNIGDIIEYNGDEVKITSIGEKPSGRIVSTGKRIFIDSKLLQG